MYHNFLIHSSVNGHLGCFHVLAVGNSAAVNIGAMCLFQLWFPQGKLSAPEQAKENRKCKYGRSASLGRNAELINATGYDDKDTASPSLPPAALLPRMDTHAPRHSHRQWNHILEAPVCLQVYFGVGGFFRLRLHPHSPPFKTCLIL